MRSIERSAAFKRDFRHVAAGVERFRLGKELEPVFAALANDWPLGVRYQDAELSGAAAGYRYCRIKPDLLLIYAKHGADVLRLARLGSSKEVFG
ncbi:MAG: type II toxin-antitoxin system YafQ family toxin [Azoarcus sp.]|jgi:mRNA interferase YafQ|nr:type II toxin-antitoxin system YafQ family toxin [Azoarcus sp.]